MSKEPERSQPADHASLPVQFSRVHQDERDRLGLSRHLGTLDGIGLALSGGGIRSASFALGALQVLLNEGLLKRIDYLSTVSGGGYVGAAVSWWLHQAALDPSLNSAPPAPEDRCADSDGAIRYEAFRQQFGSKVQGSRTGQGGHPKQGNGLGHGSNWLAYIRQHGNYLLPRGVGYPSLAATILRVCLYTLSVYASSVIGVFSLARWAECKWAAGSQSLIAVGLAVAAIAAVLLLIATLGYGPATWLTSTLGSGASTTLYRGRTSFRRWSGNILVAMLCGLLLASVPALYDYIESHGHIWLASLSSMGLGTIGTIYQFFQGRAQNKTPAVLRSVRLILTAALVLYGLLLGTYAIAEQLPVSYWSFVVALSASAVFGLFVNTNYAGLARLYRDRIMEAFLPGPVDVAENHWSLATQANTQTVSDLKGLLTKTAELVRVPIDKSPRPLHLLNCTAVLIDSDKDLYRNRGGDSFIISPLWSGSDATGWIPTKQLGDGAMSLATAVSISGAAANPNAGPNGLGITRNRLVSFLMSLFNIRLGYWMANPALAGTARSNKPNLWYPGFRQGLLGSGLSERANFLELTDGGHFDNTGVYELVRRRTELIIVSQAGCDPAFAMEDLANVIEKVRVDFSVFIEFTDQVYTLNALCPKGGENPEPAVRGFALGRIRYPKGSATSPEYDEGYIVYLQAVPTALMPSDVESYWRRHEEFPNDTTADQFFIEENLEAYRELGYAVAGAFYRAMKTPNSGVLKSVAALLLPEQPGTPRSS